MSKDRRNPSRRTNSSASRKRYGALGRVHHRNDADTHTRSMQERLPGNQHSVYAKNASQDSLTSVSITNSCPASAPLSTPSTIGVSPLLPSVVSVIGQPSPPVHDRPVSSAGPVMGALEWKDCRSDDNHNTYAVTTVPTRELAVVPQGGRSSQRSLSVMARPLVCPTCLRSFSPESRGDNDYSSSIPTRYSNFTPQYFRRLENTVLLAIEDGGPPERSAACADTLSSCGESSSMARAVSVGQRLLPPPLTEHFAPPICGVEMDALENEESPRSRTGRSDRPSSPKEVQYASSANVTGVNGYYNRYFREVQKLGSGTFGGVYLCQHVMEGVPLGMFALKKIPVGDNLAYLQNVLREVRILEEVKRHPNVVEYNHSWVDTAQLADFGPPVRCLFVLMEYASEGSLDSYLGRHGTALPTTAVWYFFLSAVAGTAHLHQKQILHRDLKPQNLLLSASSSKLPRVLVSDFGTAALLGDISYDRTGGTGTLEYMAPELLERDPTVIAEHYVNRHTKASDVWSLGMILHFLACDGMLPVQRPDGSVILDIDKMSPYKRPPEMKELIRAMLQRSPPRRPSCNAIMQSTVVQTIIHGFQSNLATMDILPQTGVGYGYPRTGGVRDERDHRHMRSSGGHPKKAQEPMESSRVELLSATTVGSPLLGQYRSIEARRAPSDMPSEPPCDPSLRMTKRLRSQATTLTAVPLPSRKSMTDAAAQTDPVRILDDT